MAHALIACRTAPDAAGHGQPVRTFNQIHALLVDGWATTVWMVGDPTHVAATSRMRALGVEVASERPAEPFDLVVLQHWRLGADWLAELSDGCVVIDAPQLELVRRTRARFGAGPGGALDVVDADAVRGELNVCAGADAVLAANARDCSLIDLFCHREGLAVCVPPSAPEVSEIRRLEERAQLVCVAAADTVAARADTAAAVSAVQYLASGTLRVVGEGVAAGIPDADGGGVRLVGPVPNLVDEISRARALLAPRASAATINDAIVVALACGTPIVTTPAGADGLQSTDGVTSASDNAGLAMSVRRLLEDDEHWRRQSTAARAAAAQFAPQRARAAFGQAVSSCRAR